MRNTLLKIAAFVLASLMTGACTGEKQPADLSAEKVEEGFRSVPDSMKLGVYWYWISDNISKEGVVRDLESMKAAGINRAFIGNIGIDNIAYGNVKVFTPEWWEILHAALKKATELDIEIGIFNSPGWSQSGGPWVKPNEAMRYLASNELKVEGPQQLKTELPTMGKEAEDVRIIAYPTPDVSEKSWTLDKQHGQELVSELTLDEQTPVRSFTFVTNQPMQTDAELLVKKGAEYQSLKKIHIDRSNPALNVGFTPFAPIVISLPETTGTDFRLVLSPNGGGTVQVTLSSAPKVERYAEKSLAKMFQTPLPMWNEYMWQDQPEVTEKELMIQPDRVVDLTAKVQKDGTLEWEVPAGRWTILRTAMVPTGVTNAPASPEATGYEIDKMSKKHVATHFDAFIGEVLKRIPAADRKSFKVVVQDSYETGGQNWTDDMIEVFKKRYGYDPVPYIPVLQGTVIGSPDLSDRFLWDLRRLVADRVSYDYVGGLREVSHKEGLTTWLENYGHWGFPGEFLQYGGQSDEVSGEFWSEGSLGDIENKAASSCAHIYGKQRVWAESFTAGGPGFNRYPYIMKQRGDRFFTEGINNTLLHVYIHQPYEDKDPGMSAWFGNEFNRKNTWYSQMDVFAEYLKRCNFMLQQGTYVADVAYFIGEDAPKMTGVCDPALPRGYSFDYINAEVLLKYASVEDGKLTLKSGMQYRVLVLPRQETMRPEVLKKIEKLVNQGLVILGPAPKRSPSLENYPKADKEVSDIASALWAKSTYGKGRVFSSDRSLESVFEELSLVPDCKVDDSAPVLFIHRATRDADYYFISNQREEPIAFSADFRVTGKLPELWNPLTGEVRYLPQFTSNGASTTLPLKLEANESSFIVFRKEAGGAPSGEDFPNDASSGENFPNRKVIHTVSTPWTVAFEADKRGPEKDVVFATLTDWKDAENDSIKYFSGTATYTTAFTIDVLPNEPLYIDLGKVMVMAKVYLNDQYVGGVWSQPYRLNITEYLKSGENTLKVEVVNNWANRLIGDWRLPEDQRKTWTAVNMWNADAQLQSSGLLGPVEIQAYDYKIVE